MAHLDDLKQFAQFPSFHHSSQTVFQPLLQLQRGLGLASCTVLATGALWAWVAPRAIAEFPPNAQLLAQRVIEGLPPPPSLPPDAAPVTPIQPTAPTLPNPAQPNPITPPPAQVTPVRPSQPAASQQYLVVVNGNSPLLLSQVQRVESGAFLQSYQGRPVIQAGLFSDRTRAEAQARTLEGQGIGAEVVAVAAGAMAAMGAQPYNVAATSDLPLPDLLPAVPVQREVEFGQPPNFSQVTPAQTEGRLIAQGSSYYVVIPERATNLPEVSTQIRRLTGGLGIGEAIAERGSPLGPHVIVGPFLNRGTANRWSRYLRDFGLDARVYYRR